MIINGTTKLSDALIERLNTRSDTLHNVLWHGENSASIILGDPAFHATYITVTRDALPALVAIKDKIINTAFNRAVQRLCD